MTNDSSFIKSIDDCAGFDLKTGQPENLHGLMMVWADWCEENDKPMRAAALRWMVKKKRYPCWHKISNRDGGWYWNYDMRKLSLHMMPVSIFGRFPYQSSGTLTTAIMFAVTRIERAFANKPHLLRRMMPELCQERV